MYNIYETFYLIAVHKPELQIQFGTSDDERYATQNMLNLQ
jgi:hypothetical protein